MSRARDRDDMTRPPRGRARWGAWIGAALVFLMASMAFMALAADTEDPYAPDEHTRVFKTELLARLAARNGSAHAESPERLLRSVRSVDPVTGPARGARRPAISDVAAARAESLARRASRRAYDGAPPTMPHSRNFARTMACLDCHRDGMYLGDRHAPAMSHTHLANCTQCHVEAENLDLEDFARPVPNAFRGMPAPTGGTRPWAGAPPVVPHHLAMRSNCLSCHGPNGYPGLKTTHPERVHCLQCHASAAQLEQTSPFHSGVDDLLAGPRERAGSSP